MRKSFRHYRLERWKKTRQKGFWHYVLIRGLLGWGVTSAAGLLLAMFFFFDTPITNFSALMTLFVYLLISFLRGCIKWVMMEKQYKETQ